jgi:flagellar biogenesis protein FliO
MRLGAEDMRTGRDGVLKTFWAELGRAFRRTPLGRLKIRRARRLHVRETLSLGERRMVAIVQCDEREFLVGATGQMISLLAPLGDGVTAANGHSFEEEPEMVRSARVGL